MRLLTFRVGMGDLRPGLAETEAQGIEQPLTLPHVQDHGELPPQEGGQGLAAPQVGGDAAFLGGGWRKTRRITLICSSVRRSGRPGRAPSCRPANPARLLARIQYSTVPGTSQRTCAACRQVMACTTSSTPWRR